MNLHTNFVEINNPSRCIFRNSPYCLLQILERTALQTLAIDVFHKPENIRFESRLKWNSCFPSQEHPSLLTACAKEKWDGACPSFWKRFRLSWEWWVFGVSLDTSMYPINLLEVLVNIGTCCSSFFCASSSSYYLSSRVFPCWSRSRYRLNIFSIRNSDDLATLEETCTVSSLSV